MYVVQTNDTVDGLVTRFRANKEKLLMMNDADVAGLPVGQRILIPDGSIIPVVTRRTVTTTAATEARPVSGGFSFGSAPIYGRNGYDYGFCTWGVANLVSVPANWGHAKSWASGAVRSGWNVSSTPSVGAVAHTAGGGYGFGHVGLVIDVNEDGSMIRYKDMNGIGGWGRYYVSDWVPAHSMFRNFLTP